MKVEYLIILSLALVTGFLIGKLIDKRNSNIIKLLIKRDELPPAAENSKWIQNAQCYMGDGSIGVTKGIYCEQIRVL
jgi:uncharacterized protein YgiB involved in biofilm formation